MNGLVNSKLIMDAWVHLRKTNNTIPNETLDFIRDVSIEKAKSLGFDGETGQDNNEYCEHKGSKGSKGWDDGTSFETQCGTKYYLTWECLFKYCPYCGKEIKL